jgi:hypothetical protein
MLNKIPMRSSFYTFKSSLDEREAENGNAQADCAACAWNRWRSVSRLFEHQSDHCVDASTTFCSLRATTQFLHGNRVAQRTDERLLRARNMQKFFYINVKMRSRI